MVFKKNQATLNYINSISNRKDSLNYPKPKLDIMLLHLGVAAIIFIILVSIGGFNKFLFIPYVAYLIWFEKPEHYPALIIISSIGSALTIVILLLTMFLPIKNWNILKGLKYRFIYFFLIGLFPIFIWQFYQRNVNLDLNVIDSVTPFVYYLGIFPFFYGAIISKKFGPTSVKVIIQTIILAFIFNLILKLFVEIESTFRLQSIAINIILTASISSLFLRKVWKEVNILLVFLGLAFIILVGFKVFELNFHTIFAILISFSIVVVYYKNVQNLIKFFVRPRVIVLVILLTVIIVKSANNINFSGIGKETLDYTNFAKYPEYLMHKAFDDRAVIWRAVWAHILEYTSIFPPLEDESYYLWSSRGYYYESTIEAHNLILELLRKLGWLAGVIVSFVFYYSIIKGGSLLLNSNLNISTVILVSSIIGIGISTALTGQFVLSINFSFAFMSILGLASGYAHSMNNLNPKKAPNSLKIRQTG